MKDWKKGWCISLAALMAAGMLAACGSNSQESLSQSSVSEETDGTQMVFSWWGNQTRNDMTQQVIDLYEEENPGVQIDGQFSSFDDYWEKLATYAAGNSLPDVIQMDYKYLAQYSNNGLLVDLTPYIEDGTLDVSGLSEDNLNIGQVNGGIYGICLTVSPPALLYNSTLLEENGIAIKDNMTLDEFYEICREVYEKTGYKTNISYGDVAYLESYMRTQDTGSLYGDGRLGADSPDSLISFFEIYETGKEEGWLIDPSVFVERAGIQAEQDPLVYGDSPETRSWCAFKYNNQITAMQSVVGDEAVLEMTTYPSPDPQKSNYAKPSQLFCVTKDSANPDEAVKFINFLLNSEEANKIILTERGIQTNTKMGELIMSDLTETDQKAIRYLNDVIIPNSSAPNTPQPEGASEVADLANNLVEEVCYGQTTAEEAGQRLFEEGNEIMASHAE